MAKAKKSTKEVNQFAKEDIKGRQTALKKTLESIEKDFGQGSIMRLGEFEMDDVEVIPTGSLSLDVALGVGGIPKGRIIEVYGPESSGKTTLTLHMVAEAQKQGGEAAFIDAEHALDPIYAKKLGVDIDRLIVSQPNDGEEALDIVERLINSSAVDLIIVDSVAALVTKAEIEGNMGDAHIGLQARLMSQALRKIAGTMNRTHTTVVFINQLREKVGVMFGNPETTTGGRALKFYSSVRIEVRRSEPIREDGVVIGNRTKAKVVKNKVGAPFKEAFFDLMFGEGISTLGNIIDLAVEFDIIKKAGSWFSYKDTKIGQGKEKVSAFLNENKDILEEVELAVRTKAKSMTGYLDAPGVVEDSNKDEEVTEEVKEDKDSKEAKDTKK